MPDLKSPTATAHRYADVVQYLRQADLARRWSISARTLERWRWSGHGPRFVKIGGAVRYRLEDIAAYEAQQVHTPPAVSLGTLPRASRG